MDVMRRKYILAVLSVGSRSGFMRSGIARVEVIFAGMNGITRCVEVLETRGVVRTT